MNRQRGFSGLIEILIYVGIFAALSVAAWAAWSKFTGQYIEQGRAEVTEKYGPIINECDKRKLSPAECVDHWLAADRDKVQAIVNLQGCEAAAAKQSQAVDDLAKRADDARRTTSAILAEIAKRSNATQGEIEKLKRMAATPAATRTEACNEAETTLRALAVRRLLYGPNASPSAGREDGDDQNSGARPVRIRP